MRRARLLPFSRDRAQTLVPVPCGHRAQRAALSPKAGPRSCRNLICVPDQVTCPASRGECRNVSSGPTLPAPSRKFPPNWMPKPAAESERRPNTVGSGRRRDADGASPLPGPSRHAGAAHVRAGCGLPPPSGIGPCSPLVSRAFGRAGEI